MGRLKKAREAIRSGDAGALRSLLEGGWIPGWREGLARKRAYAGLERRWGPEAKGAAALGETLLMQAAQRGNREILRILLEAGADPAERDEMGRTALHHAAACGREECVKELLAAGADPKAADKRELTPLEEAAGAGSAGAVRALLALLEAGSDPNRLAGRLIWGAAHRAAESGSAEAIAALASAGASLARDGSMAGPLHVAAAHGNLAAIRALARFKADLEEMSERGRTPLMAAAENGQAEAIRLLLDLGADLGARDPQTGETALMVCVRHAERQLKSEIERRSKAAIALLEAGADLDPSGMARDDHGLTALDSARKQGDAEIAEAIGRALERSRKAEEKPEEAREERGPEGLSGEEARLDAAAKAGADRMIRALQSFGKLGEGEADLAEFQAAARAAAEEIARRLLGGRSIGSIEEEESARARVRPARR